MAVLGRHPLEAVEQDVGVSVDNGFGPFDPLHLAIKGPSMHDAACRKQLAKAIVAHAAKLAELTDMRAAIDEASLKLARMREAIEKSAGAEDAVAELAADALRTGKDVSERSPAWKAKQTGDQLIADHALLKTGLARLQARASGLEPPRSA